MGTQRALFEFSHSLDRERDSRKRASGGSCKVWRYSQARRAKLLMFFDRETSMLHLIAIWLFLILAALYFVGLVVRSYRRCSRDQAGWLADLWSAVIIPSIMLTIASLICAFA